MMMIRAISLDAVNKSWTLVAALTLMQFTNVRDTVREGSGIRNSESHHLQAAEPSNDKTMQFLSCSVKQLRLTH